MCRLVNGGLAQRLLARLVFAVVFLTSTVTVVRADGGATLVSDQEDYAPGDVANLFGSGFQPGETVDLSISISNPVDGSHVGDFDYTDIVVTDTGTFLISYTVPQEAAGMNLMATAMGMTSRRIAIATFTDSHYTLDSADFTISGNTITVSVVIGGGDPKAVSVEANIAPAFPGFGLALTNTSGDTWSATFPATCGTRFNFTGVKVTGPSGVSNPNPKTLANSPALHLDTQTCIVDHAPVITCYSPTVDLGQLIGCLCSGGFGKKLDLTYQVSEPEYDPDTGASLVTVSMIVSADGTPIGSPIVVATVTDADGDDVNVDTDGPASVKLTGPGLTSSQVKIGITADDGDDDAVPCESTVTLKAQIVYDWKGFLPPLPMRNDSVPGIKKGSTLPVKFTITDCAGTPITTGTHIISVQFHSGTVPAGDPTVADSGTSNDNGIAFRYAGPHWIYNLSTKPDTYKVGSTYKITAILADGTSHSTCISMNK